MSSVASVASAAETKIVDYISGLEVAATPEELYATQVFSRMLVEDYGYPKDHIQTRPQHRVRARPSDSEGGTYPIDIGVFANALKNSSELQLIVECKQKTKKSGISQLKDYLTFSSATVGVWFNGEDRVYLHKKALPGGGIEFEELPNIPKYGQCVADIGKNLRKNLKPTHNLKSILKAIRNHVAGNVVGATRDEALAAEIINIIFCKIFDEKSTKPSNVVSFRVGAAESDAGLKTRIDNLFSEVKATYPAVFTEHDTISLSANSLRYVVGELQNYCLLETDRDVVADAFEVFIGPSLKGAQGQFFTPRNVVKLAIELVSPGQRKMIIDPACGSGGFIVEALKYKWAELDKKAADNEWSAELLANEKMREAINNVRGIEKDAFLAKVAKAYMALLGDGHGHVYCENSLSDREQWSDGPRQNIPFNSFDVVVANPPYGEKIRVEGEDVLKNYVLGRNAQGKISKDGVRPDVLFIERCYDLLKPGGTMAIVLVETFFHAPGSRAILDFMRHGKLRPGAPGYIGNNVKCVVDLPHNTFRPNCNAKTLLVVLEKETAQQPQIRMAVAEEMGHDHRGEPLYRWQADGTKSKTEVWDDLDVVLKEHRGVLPAPTHSFDVCASEIAKTNVLVPRYYWRGADKLIDAKLEALAATGTALELVRIGDLIDEGILTTFDGHGSPDSDYKGRGEVPYVRVADIVNLSVYKNPTAFIPEFVAKEMWSPEKDSHALDILFVRRGSYRIGSVAMVSPYEGEMVLTRELLTLRVNATVPLAQAWQSPTEVAYNNARQLDPFLLLYGLTHELTQWQLKTKVLIDTTLPNIGDRWKDLRIPLIKDAGQRAKIASQLRESFVCKWESQNNIASLLNVSE